MRRFSDQDLMMCITMWGPSARGKVKLLTPKETREGVDSYTKTDIYRSVSHGIYLCTAISDTLMSKHSVENNFKWDQNRQFTSLRETMSIPFTFMRVSLPGCTCNKYFNTSMRFGINSAGSLMNCANWYSTMKSNRWVVWTSKGFERKLQFKSPSIYWIS